MASKSMQLGHEAGASLMRSFIKSQFLTKPQRTPSDIDLTGQVAIITGGSSGLALWAKFPNRDRRPLLPSFDDPNITSWDGVERYFSSKMLGHLFFVRLLPYLNPDEVIVNLVEPGMCKDSDLHREATGTTGVFLKVYKALTGRKPEDGARTTDYMIRFTQLVYLPEGQPIMNVLWEETIAEFEFASVRDILKLTK
ncbi:hypothetical protein EIK77_001905 [Talaromyces pinophilus]|nr:hypothetical protein EIK77_001905 [Talaromyces pinophilus]